ncbi:MAG: hypothetical protein ACLVCH_04485 [Roseburia inulinivorans]
MQAEPAVTEMSMDDMDILKELEGSSDDDKKGKKKKEKEKKKKEKAPKRPKEKKVKPKKEKKPKPLKQNRITHRQLPKVPVILVFVMASIHSGTCSGRHTFTWIFKQFCRCRPGICRRKIFGCFSGCGRGESKGKRHGYL